MLATYALTEVSKQLLIISELSDSDNLFIITVNVILSFWRKDRLRLYAVLLMGRLFIWNLDACDTGEVASHRVSRTDVI